MPDRNRRGTRQGRRVPAVPEGRGRLSQPLDGPIQPEPAGGAAGCCCPAGRRCRSTRPSPETRRSSAGDAAYWGRNIREPVYFARAMRALSATVHRVFLEVGPHPVLSASIRECLAEAGIDGIVLTSLRRDKPETATFLEALGGLYVAGCPVDWQQVHAGSRFVPLPTYPWQRETHWQESPDARSARLGGGAWRLAPGAAGLPRRCQPGRPSCPGRVPLPGRPSGRRSGGGLPRRGLRRGSPGRVR